MGCDLLHSKSRSQRRYVAELTQAIQRCRRTAMLRCSYAALCSPRPHAGLTQLSGRLARWGAIP